MDCVAYDTAVMSGRGRAKEFLAQSGGDPEKFMELRENFLHGLIEKNPAKYGKYGPAWDNRNQSLRAGLDGGPAMAFAPAEDRPANAGLAAMPPQSSDGLAPARGGLAPALATAGEDSAPAQGVSGMIRGTPASGLGERALDFATSERFLVPLLTGLGAMASSGSRYLAPAALQGLGAGAKSYIEVPKSQAETAKIAEEAKVQAAEAAAKRQLVPKIGVETKRLQSELYDRQWVPNVGWMVYDRTNPYSTPVRISDVNGNPLPGSESYRGIPAAPATAEGPQKPPAPLSAAPPAQTPTSPKPPGAGIGDALDWKATVAAPNGVEIPGALNSALSGDIKNQQETAQREIEDQGKRAKAAYDQQYRLREMERQISNLTKDGGFLLPGTNADMRLEVAKAANTFSTMFGGGPIFDPNNVAAGENLAKDSTQLGFATARQLGHEPGFIVSQSIKANPSMENSPMAFKRIVAGLREAANYEQDRLQFLESYRGKYQTTAGADALFRKLNPPEAYARRAILSTIDEEDLRHLREMPKDKLLSRKKKIDKEYGEGTTNLLAGGE
jgi:hypothetical protein